MVYSWSPCRAYAQNVANSRCWVCIHCTYILLHIHIIIIIYSSYSFSLSLSLMFLSVFRIFSLSLSLSVFRIFSLSLCLSFVFSLSSKIGVTAPKTPCYEGEEVNIFQIYILCVAYIPSFRFLAPKLGVQPSKGGNFTPKTPHYGGGG